MDDGKICKALSYVAERGRPVDFVVGADAGVLCLEGKGEGRDVEDQDVWSISDLSGVQKLVRQALAAVCAAVGGTVKGKTEH